MIFENPTQETIGDKIATIVDINEDGLPIVQFDGEEEPSEKLYPISGLFKPEIGQRVMMKRFNDTYIIEYNILYLEVLEDPVRNNFEGNVNINGNLKVDDINSSDISCRNVNADGKGKFNSLEVARNTNIDGDLTVTDISVRGIIATDDSTIDGKLNVKELNVAEGATLKNISIGNELNTNTLKVSNMAIIDGLKVNGNVGFFGITPTNKKSINQPGGTAWQPYAMAISELLDILEGYGLIEQRK